MRTEQGIEQHRVCCDAAAQHAVEYGLYLSIYLYIYMHIYICIYTYMIDIYNAHRARH